jgi:hypothetical protein
VLPVGSTCLSAPLTLLIVEFLPLLSTKSYHLNSYHAVPAASLNQSVPILEDHHSWKLDTQINQYTHMASSASPCWLLLSRCLGIHSIAHQRRRCPNTLYDSGGLRCDGHRYQFNSFDSYRSSGLMRIGRRDSVQKSTPMVALCSFDWTSHTET